MRHYYREHDHTTPRDLRQASTQSYGAVVGTVDTSTEKPITGRNGDHLQFYVSIGTDLRYQVDVNTQSKDGTAVLVYVADETLTPSAPNQPFGMPAFGAYLAPDAKLSYQGVGLTDDKFISASDTRIEAQLEAALGEAEFVAVYGQLFDDGGDDGKGIHETHRNPGKQGQDGAVVVYLAAQPGQPLTRRWFFFMFRGETVS
jgi:hypothetical protein